MKQSIVFSANSSWYLYNFRRKTISAFLNLGYRVFCIAKRDDYTVKLSQLGAEFIDLNYSSHSKNPFSLLSQVLYMRRLLKQCKPIFLFNFTIKNNILGPIAALNFNIKVINNISGLGTVFIRKSFVTSFVKLLYRFSNKYVKTIFCQNKDDFNFLLANHLANKDQLELIPGSGVDLEKFHPRFRGQKQKDFIFIYLGRLIIDKGVIELLEAFKRLLPEFQNTRLLIYGDYDSSNPRSIDPKIIELNKSNNYISFFDHTDEPKEILARVDCLVLPSYREGMPRSVLEASSMGIPCITSNVPGCRDAVIDGKTGLLCEPNNVNDLYIKMKQMRSMPRDSLTLMSNHARKHIEDNFSEHKAIKPYIDFLN